MPSRDYGRAGEQVRAPCDKTRLERKWLRRTTEYSKGLHRTHVDAPHLCSSVLWNLLLLGLGAGLGKCRQVQASGIVSMYGWMDVWRRAHLSTGASREAPVDNESFSTILTKSTPGISGSRPCKPCSVAVAQFWDPTHTLRKVLYNACSVAVLSARMLMLCSSAQWSSST